MPKITFLPGAKESLDATARNKARANAAYVPSYSQEKPICPAGSAALYRANWKKLAVRLEELGLFSRTFEGVIQMTVEQMTFIDRLRALLAKNGNTYVSATARGGTTIRARPEVALLHRAERLLRMLFKDLGLTPGEHARIGLRRKENSGNQSTGDWSGL